MYTLVMNVFRSCEVIFFKTCFDFMRAHLIDKLAEHEPHNIREIVFFQVVGNFYREEYLKMFIH